MCKISVACIRQLPSHSATLISQMLFGEFFEIVSKKNKDWFRIKCSWDHTVGWIDPKQVHVFKEKEVKYKVDCQTYALEHIIGIRSSKSTIPISLGSNLVNFDGLNMKLPFGTFQYGGQIIDLSKSKNKSDLVPILAKKYMHAPYMKGGRTILGVDGSGLAQVIFKMIGINLPRNCEEQAQQGTDIGFISEVQAGDLAFFSNGNDNRIVKVGIVMAEKEVMHVHGQVRVDIIDHQGIYDKSKKKYLYNLRTIRRLISD